MLSKIFITDLAETRKISEDQKPTFCNAWISIVDPEDENDIKQIEKNFKKQNILYYYDFFYDISDEGINAYIPKKWLKRMPEKKHLIPLISFIQKLITDEKDYYLGINCYAGISRSSAIAVTALFLAGKFPQKALDYVLSARPIAWPNSRILRLISEILKKPELYETFKKWKESQKEKIYIPLFK